MRPDFFGNRLPPFLGMRENRIHIVDNPPEGILPVPDQLTYGELRNTGFHGKQLRQ
jgi:hypothetical protein